MNLFHQVLVDLFGGLILALLAAAWKRYRILRAAKRYVGVYAAENIQNRTTTPMPGAGLTVISARPLWMLNPRTLDAFAYDNTPHGKREHCRHIFLDPLRPTRAEATLKYRTTLEVSHQILEMIDADRLLVTPIEQAYRTHVLRRLKGLLLLN